MQQDLTLNSLQTLLYFPFKDTASRNKLLTATALGFASLIIPIIPWILVLGYAGAVMRQIIVDGKEASMPEWGDWNKYLSLGGKLFGVSLIYTIPVWAPMFLGYFLMMLPAVLIPFFENSHRYSDSLVGTVMLFSFGGMALFFIGMFFSMIIWFFLPPALAHAAANDSFAAGFKIRDWWKILRANLGGFILAMVIGGGLYMVLMFAVQIVYMTLILCFLLPFLMTFMGVYLYIVVFALMAQAYRDGLTKLEAQTT